MRGLHAKDYQRRLKVVLALGGLEDARRVDALGRALADASVRVRLAAVTALESSGGAEAAEYLLGAVVDRDARVATAAKQALSSLAPHLEAEVLERGLHRWPRRARRILKSLIEAGRPEPVLALLTVRNPRVRTWAVAALAEADHVAGTDLLARGLSQLSPGPRAAAARALGALRRPSATAPLQRLLVDGDPRVRRSAADALGTLGTAAGAALVDLRDRTRHDPSFWVRRACRRALRHIETALRTAPPELEAAPLPAGSGLELEAAENEEDHVVEPRPAPWWMFWRHWR
ncbi:MAG: HEAT repeat domain-containing protein [Armatimonadota bacterium]|nr:HEAT repeat domain-containing protein [Armatimonadota bacterium]